jgi:pseudouridine synthase
MEIILQKFIAQTGYCSRRKAEDLIRSGQVKVNGVVAKIGEYFEENDLCGKLEVNIKGQRLDLPEEKKYIILNKPAGYVCTTRRFKSEKNVFELLGDTPRPEYGAPLSKRGIKSSLSKREGIERHLPFSKGEVGWGYSLIIAGRLDKDSRGLLLLTNDGELVYRLTHPKFRHEKKYHIQINTDSRQIDADDTDYILRRFTEGIDIGEGDGVVKVKKIRCLDPLAKENLQFEIILTEGKKRQIRRMFKKIGFKVLNLTRIAIGGLELSNLEEGKCRNLSEQEIKMLRSGK